MGDPDFIYDPDDWEYTSEYKQRDDLTEEALRRRLGEIKRFCTLVQGPDKFAAYVLRDGAADEGDVELRWFDSEAEARVACGMPPYIGAG